MRTGSYMVVWRLVLPNGPDPCWWVIYKNKSPCFLHSAWVWNSDVWILWTGTFEDHLPKYASVLYLDDVGSDMLSDRRYVPFQTPQRMIFAQHWKRL